MNWNLGTALKTNSVLGSSDDLGTSAPTVAFNDVAFGLGSYLGSMVQPIANAIDEITAPLAPVYAVMQAPLPGLSDLSEAAGSGPITIDTLVALAVNAQVLPPDYQLLADLGLRLHDLVELIRSAQFSPDSDALIPLGNFDLGGSKNGDLRDSTLNHGAQTLAQWVTDSANLGDVTGDLTNLIPHAVNAASSIENTIKNDIGSLHLLGPLQNQVTQIFNQIDQELATAKNGVSLTFPLLDDPASIYKLLLGQDVDFVKFDATAAGSATETKQIPVWGPIEASFTGTINVNMELHAGVDTYGLRQFFISIIQGHTDVSTLDQGFYVISNQAEPLVKISGGITAKAGPKLTFGAAGSDFYAEATFNGSVQSDPNNPVQVSFVPANSAGGKLRPATVNGDLFSVTGTITANLSFSVSGGFEVAGNVIDEATVFSLPLAQKTLFDTTASVRTANPFNEAPVAPSIDVIFDANGFADVPYGNLTITYDGIVQPSYDLSSVRSITIYGSADESTEFNVRGDFGPVPFHIHGGESTNDTLVFDDKLYSTAGTPSYVVQDTMLERYVFLPGSVIPTPSTFLDFQGIESVNLYTPDNQSAIVHVDDLATPTTIYGGDQGNVFYLGAGDKSLTNVLDLLNLHGGLGDDKVIIDDTANIAAETFAVGHDQLTLRRTFKATSSFFPGGSLLYFSPFQTLHYSSIDDLEINAGGGGNTFIVNDVPGAGDFNPTAMTLVLGTGSNSDIVNLTATTGPVIIHGQGGLDVVNVGVAQRGTLDISASVFVDNAASPLYVHGTTLNINDADDSTVRTVTFDTPVDNLGTITGFVGTHTYPNPFSPPQTTTTIEYTITDLQVINVQGDNAINTFDVVNTPRNFVAGIIPRELISTHLTLGTYFNTVNVWGTTGPLIIVERPERRLPRQRLPGNKQPREPGGTGHRPGEARPPWHQGRTESRLPLLHDERHQLYRRGDRGHLLRRADPGLALRLPRRRRQPADPRGRPDAVQQSQRGRRSGLRPAHRQRPEIHQPELVYRWPRRPRPVAQHHVRRAFPAAPHLPQHRRHGDRWGQRRQYLHGR